MAEDQHLRTQGFVAYDQYTAMLRDAEGKISGPATVLAGFATGITESAVAVTPFESIKTQMYASSHGSCKHALTDWLLAASMIERAETLACVDSYTVLP